MLNNALNVDVRNSKIKNNFHKLLEYSNSLKQLKDTITENHDINIKIIIFIFFLLHPSSAV
jgi:hypothetical protein